jgi:hypothetical protein
MGDCSSASQSKCPYKQIGSLGDNCVDWIRSCKIDCVNSPESVHLRQEDEPKSTIRAQVPGELS